MKKLILITFISIVMIGVVGGGIGHGQQGPLPKKFETIPSGHSSEVIQVKFRDGTTVDNPQQLLPPDLLDSVKEISPLFALPKDKLRSIKNKGEKLSKKKVPDLTLWFSILLKKDVDAVSFIERLGQLDTVEIVEPAPLPAPPPQTPDLTPDQGYLEPATGGIDAEYSWTVPGGNGTGIMIYDVEYSWNQNHEDLDAAAGVALLLNPGETAVDPFNDNNHGTAVLGELIATNDTIGVTGISWGAGIGLAPARTNVGYNPASAILLAVADGAPGDVILIEQQICVCGLTCTDASQDNLGPLEWSAAVFSAIQTAVANGFVVVEAAGNGGVDLDRAECNTYFNRNVQDSGAIIVGAGQPPGSGNDREREDFSCYGSRVDLQGWGSGVTTTGYNGAPPCGYSDSADPANPNFWYTYCFAGTSSASPIVTGAAANLQGIALARTGVLPPSEVRRILVETGSPQLGDVAEHIGPRPNLRLAIAQLLPVVRVPGDVSFGDTCLNTTARKEVNVCNTGKQDLVIYDITGSGPFSVERPSPDFPVVISADFCIPFTVLFTPVELLESSYPVAVLSNDPVNPTLYFRANGTGVTTDIRVTGSTAFGDVCAESLAEKTISVCNVGKCNLHVSNVAFNPACPGFTLVNNPFPADVSPDSCVNVTIRFTPGSAGAKSCSLVIQSNDLDQSIITLPVTANTPLPSIDVSPDQCFPPEVVQSIGACSTQQPFPISNKGSCNLTITDISEDSADYSVSGKSGLPSFPIILKPGDVAGAGDLKNVFEPTELNRNLSATLSVTYVSEPVTGVTSTVTRRLSGEGVNTGARVLVKAGGVALGTVEKIQLQRINGNRNKTILDTVDVARDLTLTTLDPDGPCPTFQYHREYGTVDNPIQLLPGSYRVTATAIVNGKRKSKTVGFDVGTCDFNPTIVISF